MAICISISIEMGSAWWPNICSPGDTYTERGYKDNSKGCESTFADDWCSSICSSIERSVAKKNCQEPFPNKLNVQCCCKEPTPAPGSPPSPSLPPASPSPPLPPGPWPEVDNRKICSSGQEYVQFPHANITDCVLKPQCEIKCKEKRFSNRGSQCIGGVRNTTMESRLYYVLEQCCCGNLHPPPPPPSPSPPPPPPPPPSPLPPPPYSPPCPSCPPPENTCDIKNMYVAFHLLSNDCNLCVDRCKKKCLKLDSELESECCMIGSSSIHCRCCCGNNTPILSSPLAVGRLLSFITE
ncbi:pollen-specific leucine-rich repeat extensin-like protein 4 [Papaver somniferum]|uniref:pollen-specific leucine-rich repeat extensin-like protein 4 n=1 Tax=Papaver somniferum TaxID=3469 RepID=UPI000E6FCE8D|nr:pollen-specific leucine-rich repeat extensin-like protein 4 [Papaver somniferum]